jgi:hypothetical protein
MKMEDKSLRNLVRNISLGLKRFYRVPKKKLQMKKLEKIKKLNRNSKKIKLSRLLIIWEKAKF